MRILSASLITLSFLAAPLAANAHDVPKKKTDITEFKLPTEAEIEQIIDEMPDLNRLMDGMMAIAEDEDLMNSLEDAGESVVKAFEQFEEMELRDNGMPDLNFMMETMLRTMSDEEVMGDMLNVVEELQEVVEENFDGGLLD